MPKIVSWSKEQAKQELSKRLYQAKDARRPFEVRWRDNEKTVYNTRSKMLTDGVNYNIDQLIADTPDNADSSITVNYTFKNLRFIHAQMSSNPPSVVPHPTSNDPDDRRKADAANRIIKFALRQYRLQDVQDRATLQTLLYGTGFTKITWDPHKGDIIDADPETGELTLEGDLSVTVPSTWDIFLDPDVSCWEDVRYVFERLHIPYEEACYLFPEQKDLLEQARNKNEGPGDLVGQQSALSSRKYDTVEIYQYWEKGMPLNGMLGRFCYCLESGDVLGELSINPERYSEPKMKPEEKEKPGVARLPYSILTDIDMPNQIYGKSFVDYTSALQDVLNRIDSVMFENLQAHGVARLILPEGAEVADDSITNSPWDIVKITGSQPPHFMEPMPLPPAASEMRQQMKMGIDDEAGVNESMFGQQSREQSGFSMQYATNQGNMVRRRLFNKYVDFVETMYKSILRIVRKKWDVPKTIQVLGKEKAFEVTDIKGADIDGGFDLVVQYGTEFSLDPMTRRQEIMTMLPLFEKAGVPTRTLMSMLKLNELSNMHDIIDLAADRQREIFEEMLATNLYIAPVELQDHKNMLDFAYYFVMTTEYKYLPEDQKALINKHIKEREQLAAAQQNVGQPGTEAEAAAGPEAMLGGLAAPALDL